MEHVHGDVPPRETRQERAFTPLSNAAKGLIFAGLMATSMGQTVLFSILGPLGRELALSELQVGAIIAVSALTVVLVSPWWGRRSDRVGRKPVFVSSVIGFSVTTLLFSALLALGLAGFYVGWAAFAVLVAGRVLYALVVAGGQPSAAGFIADTTAPEDRAGAMALVGGAFGVGSILGPGLAFLLAPAGVLVPLFAVAFVGGVIALLCIFFLPESPRLRDADADKPALRLLDRRIWPILLGVLGVFVAVAMVQQTLAFFVQDLGGLGVAETAQRTGAYFALFAAANLAAVIAVARARPAPAKAVAMGGALATVGVSLLLLAPITMPALAASSVIMGAGFGALIPGLQGGASVAVGPDEQGAAGGFVAAAMAAGYIIGPLAGPATYMAAPAVTHVAAMICVGLGAGLAAYWIRRA
ncbi:MAG: MFS transporter [Pseudomonadota bacterium]